MSAENDGRYVGCIILEVDGQDVEIAKIQTEITTGKKLVLVMSRAARAAGRSKGISQIKITVSAPIPLTGPELDWAELDDATLVIEPAEEGGERILYRGCFSTKVGAAYQVEGEAMRDIEMHAITKFTE